MNNVIKIELTREEVETVLSAVVKEPMYKVNELYWKIRRMMEEGDHVAVGATVADGAERGAVS